MVVRVENNNGQRVGENQGSALDQLRKTVVSYSLEEEVIRAELRWVLKMVESDYSFNSAENMVKLLCLMDELSKIFPKMTLGRMKFLTQTPLLSILFNALYVISEVSVLFVEFRSFSLTILHFNCRILSRQTFTRFL